MKTGILLTCACLMAVCLTGCYPVKAYHLNDPVKKLDTNITLAYIEFDDNGEMYDQAGSSSTAPFTRPQLDKTIETILGAKARNGARDPVNVVVFIHGWKNDAGNSNNVAGFQQFLKQIYASYQPLTPQPPPLIGIYIGWRGAAVKFGKDLSYWTRSTATTRVAGPHLEEALYRIIRTVKGAPGAIDTKSTLVLIGHSFGGRVLEKAMTAYYENTMLAVDGADFNKCVPLTQASGSETKRISLAGKIVIPDLTLLLNEAAPATDAKQFLEFLKCHGVQYTRRDPRLEPRKAGIVFIPPAGQPTPGAPRRVIQLPPDPVPDSPTIIEEGSPRPQPHGLGDRRDYPLFLSVTSEGDVATSVALPIGQTVARTQLKTRNYESPDPPEIPNQSTYFTHSAANIEILHSHALAPECNSAANDVFRRPIAGTNHLCKVPVGGNKKPDWNHTPYWIFKIPVSIVPDHSDIFHPALYSFLSAFLPSPEELARPEVEKIPDEDISHATRAQP